MTELQIIKKAGKRDRKAQESLYNSYQSVWFSICLRYQKNRVDASDALQNALINIFSKLDQFNPEKGKFKSWSCRIVVNDNLMHLRQKVKSFKVDDIDDHIDIRSQNETPLDIMSAEELTKLVQNLPSGYRTIFNLYVIEGYSHREIADLLNISEGTSKSQLFKAKKLLQQKIEVLI